MRHLSFVFTPCIALAVALAVVLGGSAHAESLSSTFPAARFYPDPVGILFPGYNVAAGVNASAISLSGKGTAIQAAVSPSLSSGVDPTQFFGSVASTKGKFGLGLGYLGSKFGGTLTNGMMAGAGYAFEAFSIGLGLRDSNLKGGFNPEVDASLTILSFKEVIAGAVFYHINGATQLDLGVGAKSGKRYNLEVNLLLPPFSNMSGGYTATASAAIYTGAFGLHFRVSYYTQSGGDHFSETFGMGAWLSENVNLILQFSTVRQATVALTVAF